WQGRKYHDHYTTTKGSESMACGDRPEGRAQGRQDARAHHDRRGALGLRAQGSRGPLAQGEARGGEVSAVIERQRIGKRGDGSLVRFDNSPNWFFAYRVRGVEHRESTGTEDPKKAKQWARRKLDEIAADRQGLKQYLAPVAKRVTVAELFDDHAA